LQGGHLKILPDTSNPAGKPKYLDRDWRLCYRHDSFVEEQIPGKPAGKATGCARQRGAVFRYYFS
jgi:hypothetical protein